MSLSARVAMLFVLSALSFCNASAASSVTNLDRHLPILKRELSSWVWKSQGESACSLSQVRQIIDAVEYTKILANAAVTNLDGAGDSSPAYRRWLGDANSKPGTVASITRNHFEAVLSELEAPLTESVASEQEDGPDPNRLVFTYPDDRHPVCEKHWNGNGPVAGMLNAGDIYSMNVLRLCPPFFRLGKHSKMVSKWRSSRGSILVETQGFSRLHEMQHLDAIVGRGNRAADHAYEVEECEALDKDEKLTNAQNFALFALDSLVNPPWN
ncbi:hypothetical protein CTRI78_v005327 [Colletotrichum trifolii]|uniref:Lysine-specific metallo-endopeptidase domain-containing protein n=1 Tax=Colletotrichum trifolii TaxID=5466 RepID=A0A4R8RLY9_COLTR|nr:hypothetical protein CTRI78_v005327 [Colletotrichum trifolii]